MNVRLIRLAILVYTTLFALEGYTQKVYITNTRADAASQLMDLNWKRAANLIGAAPEIIDHTYLDSLHILNQADVVIVASGVKTISTSQRDALLEFIKDGGHVYVQSEFKMNFAGNQLFSYLVNKSGGNFAWEGETRVNLNPISFPSYITGESGPSKLEYFWNGTYGCGGETIFPIASHNDLHYGFLHTPADATSGRIMTLSDQDWIKIATEVGQGHRLTMMRNLLNSLANGVGDLVTPDLRISFLQQSLCPGTPFDVEAKIDATVLNYQLNWYKNGIEQVDLVNKTKFVSDILEQGDILQAKIFMLEGCTMDEVNSNIVEIERVFPLSMSMPSISGDQTICAGNQGIFVAEIASMPDPAEVNYVWNVDGVDLTENNDTLRIDDPKNGSVIKLSASFNDGCTRVESTAESIALEVIGNPITNISLSQNKAKYCEDDTAIIELSGTPVDVGFKTTWIVDNVPFVLPSLTYELPSLTNDHEVYATVEYDDPCEGRVQLSTQVVTISIDQPILKITEKQNTSCGLENGAITVAVEGGLEPYAFQWNANSVGNQVNNLPMGMQTIQMTDDNGCSAMISTAIGEVNPKIIDSLVIINQSCDSDETALVQLYTNPTFSDDIDIQWIDTEGNAINGNFAEGEFAPGQYNLKAGINENCQEERQFEIQSQDLMSQIVKEFETEAEFFITLDLGIPSGMVASIKWTGDAKLDCDDCTWPSFLATESQLLQVELTTTSGCAYNFEVKVNVSIVEKLPYYAPSGFSPDGDDLNEEFEFFTDASIASLQELLIFDRWGNVVYEAKEMNTVHWDGTIQGKPAERGVYVYVAKMVGIDGKEIIGNGSVMLIR